MPPQYKRLVRRQPLAERIKNYLDPWDFLLWVSEELESSDWEQWSRDWAIPLGFAINFVMLIARANSSSSNNDDDIFSDQRGGLLNWLATFVVHFLTVISCANAFYTFYRQRHYRMFEAAIETPLSTPSARRVRVDSSPVSSSPLRYLSSVLGTSAESRAHPDPAKHVWEISIWDPTPLCLRMFCLFSPGHVLVYWLLLPASSQDTRPSTTVVLTIALVAVLSFQLYFLQSNFSQQSKDTSLVQKEVLNEYDIKYVHPRTQPLMRDAAIQCSSLGSKTTVASEVDTYQPVTVISRGFYTNPNQNYVKHFNPDATPVKQASRSSQFDGQQETPSLRTPADVSSPVRHSSPIRSTAQRHSMAPRTGDGGSLGVYTHDRSPLKKAASQNLLNQRFNHLNQQGRRESGRF